VPSDQIKDPHQLALKLWLNGELMQDSHTSQLIFDVAEQILAAGLMPIIEPEVNIKSVDRAQSDVILRDEILKALDNVSADNKVMLKLSIPAQAGTA
jgi:fructose-bisphosphate aldolase class 1